MDDEQRSADPDEDLEQRLALMKGEIDALQVQVADKSKPWYKQLPVVVSLLVSVVALSFSIWNDHQSEVRLRREEVHDARVELRGLIQRLQELPKENFEIFRTYSDDALAQRALSPLVNTENQVLARQAAQLIEELHGDVTATEYYATAVAFYSSDLPAEATSLIKEGLRVADDPISETALLRQDAIVRFALGDVEGGRGRWQQAIEAWEKYPEENGVLVAATNMATEMSWAESELALGDCAEATRHITAAKDYSSAVGPEHFMVGQVTQTETAITEACRLPLDS